ncbi:hypothetical protein WN944_028857 [Citrus x changshan-huyou]|uniref:Uncharacterized protein n=1 Tax=Citrus x changshan-huyou TaxID=2935761 RepID=A0AAP0QAK1_9ROSI
MATPGHQQPPSLSPRSHAHTEAGQHQQPLSLMLALYYVGVNTVPLLPKKTLTHIQTLAVEENPIINCLKLKPSLETALGNLQGLFSLQNSSKTAHVDFYSLFSLQNSSKTAAGNMQMRQLRDEGSSTINDELYALACGPDKEIRLFLRTWQRTTPNFNRGIDTSEADRLHGIISSQQSRLDSQDVELKEQKKTIDQLESRLSQFEGMMQQIFSSQGTSFRFTNSATQ